MYLFDANARRQIAREHADELARDARRAAAAPDRPQPADRAGPAALLHRFRRRRPARAAAQRP
jgi:hypothetical protein